MISDSTYNLKIFQSGDALSRAAAEFIVEISGKSIAERGKFLIALSGGKTPEQLYLLLAEPFFRDQMQWDKTFVFWGDERCVPLEDERNNAHQAKLLLLDKINIPAPNIYPIPVNLSPAEAASKYEKEMNSFFEGGSPRLDFLLLGLGENGHTASLFPRTKVIAERAMGIREVYLEDERIFRVTMTAPLINKARQILFLVGGKNKAEILKKVLRGPYLPDSYPAQLVRPEAGCVSWFVDQAAASYISV